MKATRTPLDVELKRAAGRVDRSRASLREAKGKHLGKAWQEHLLTDLRHLNKLLDLSDAQRLESYRLSING